MSNFMDNMEKPVIETNDPTAEAYDREGNARKTHVLTNGETFYGSDKELVEENARNYEERNNK